MVQIFKSILQSYNQDMLHLIAAYTAALVPIFIVGASVTIALDGEISASDYEELAAYMQKCDIKAPLDKALEDGEISEYDKKVLIQACDDFIIDQEKTRLMSRLD